MKKSLIIGLVSLAAGVTSTFAQGFITLDNYNSFGGAGGPLVTYGAGTPGGSVGSGLASGWTIGLYYAVGDIGLTEAAGSGTPNSGLALATGTGSTAPVDGANSPVAGYFLSQQGFNTGAAAGGVVTAELTVFDGSDYLSSAYRGHSAAFTITTVSITSPNPSLVGDAMGANGGFSAMPVPEPTTLALAGLGSAAMLIFRKKK